MIRLLGAALLGALAAGASVLLHHQFSFFGVLLALVGSATTIWSLVQKSGRRSAGFVAAGAWITIAWRAALPGAGGELLVQGDWQGEVLVVLGSIVALATAALSRPK